MGSATDDIQIQTEDARSKSTSLNVSGLPLTAALQCPAHVQNKDQAISGLDSAIKVRKQYTITKQRERWTDEEHNKFLEALKMHGRAWRHIEEHVGTKTAVQIRSHAQKFFSKVSRESSINEENTAKPIKIPPPRPKRKPMHPYPRKTIGPVKTRAHLSQELRRSASPSLSVLEHKTQSPASVLSAVGSEAIGVIDSNMPNCVFSRASSDPDDQPNGLFRSVPSPEEKGSEDGSNSPTQGNGSSTEDDHVSTKLELFPEDGTFVKEGSNEEVSTQTLKLFGKTVTVTVAESSLSSSRNNSNNADEESTTHVPWWAFYGGVPYPFVRLHNYVPAREYNYFDGNDVQDKVLQKHGSLTGSNSGIINAEMDGE